MQGLFLSTAAAAPEAGGAAMIMQFLPMILIVGVFYLLLIRPQKKREKETQDMRSNIEVGDEIITIGGIIGTVVLIKDEYLVIETGSDRSKVRIVKGAVQTNTSPRFAAAAAAASAKKGKNKKEDVAKEDNSPDIK